jgi:proline iminopeptidase
MKVLKKIGKILLIIVLVLAAVYLSFYLLAWGDYHVAQTVEHDPSIPHIEFNDVILHAETFGSDTNQVVIIIHGGPGNDYRNLLDLKALADEYFVVFYDQRGTGLSPRVPAEQLTVDNLVTDLYNIVQYYAKGEQVNIIGHSWGGMLASAYISRYPNTVDHLVLAEPGPLNPALANLSGIDTQLEFSWELLVHAGKCYFKSLHVAEIDDQARVDYLFQAFMLNTELANHPLAGYYCNQDVTDTKFNYWRFSYLTSYEIMMKGMQGDKSNMNFGDGVGQFENKVLFISGACNILIGADFQQEQMKLFRDAEMVVIEDTGHFMFEEKPDECILAVRSYFDN